MIWSKLRGEHYAKGTTTYRITPYPAGWYLLDAWCVDFGGWAMLGRAGSMEAAQLWAECEEIFQTVEAT